MSTGTTKWFLCYHRLQLLILLLLFNVHVWLSHHLLFRNISNIFTSLIGFATLVSRLFDTEVKNSLAELVVMVRVTVITNLVTSKKNIITVLQIATLC